MLASARYGITSGHIWVFIFPALAFAISIIGFNLIGEGLNYELSKRNSMVITRIKRLGFHLNPKTYIHEIKNYKRYKRNLAIKTMAIIIIILLTIPSGPSAHQLDSSAVFNHVVEISKDKYEGRLVGTHGQDEFANYIVEQLKLSKVEPLFNGEYIQEFSLDEFPEFLDSADLFINNENGELINNLVFRKDFNIDTWFYTSNENDEGKVSLHSTLESLSGEIMYLAKGGHAEFDPDKEYFVLLGDNFTRRPVNSLNNISKVKNVKAAIIPIESSRTLDSQYFLERKEPINFVDLNMNTPPLPAIFVNKETAEKIRQLEGNKITIKANPYNSNNITGKNVGGIIKGKTREKPLVITSSYDYLGSDGTNNYLGLYNNGSSIAAILELPVMLSFTKIITKYHNASLLKLAGLFFTLKAVITLLSSTVGMIYFAQSFQMLSYAIFIPGSIYYVNKVIDKSDMVKGQAFTTAATTLGGVGGSLIGGLILSFASVTTMLVIGVVISLAGTLILLLSVET